MPKPLFSFSLRLGFDDEQRRSSDVESSCLQMSPRPGIGLYREISSLGLNSSLNFINASLYCLRIDLYVSPSVNTLFYPFSSCFMRIARLPFDEDLVTETFLLRFAISEFYHCLGMELFCLP